MPDILVTKSEKYFLSKNGFRLFKTIGLGTDSKIYLANYESPLSSNRYCLACKVYDIKKMQKKYVVKFLPREIDILISISHPCIIQIHSIFIWRSRYYIFMRYAERGDLFDYIKYNGCLAEMQARVWYKQICLAIKYLHSMDIVHRDLKCENVLLTRNYNIKLADFGFSRSAKNDQGEFAFCETYCGSLLYTAPEIIKGKPYLGKPIDMWALGVILYVMVNRSMPFYEENIKKLYELQMSSKWKFKSRVVDNLSDAVKTLIVTLLLPDPEVRFDINDVLNSEWILQDVTVQAPVKLNSSGNAVNNSKDWLDKLEEPPEPTHKDSLQPATSECIIIKNISEIKISYAELPSNQSPAVRKKRRCCII